MEANWLIGLPGLLEVEYLHDVYELEEVKKMPYISNAEKFGIEIGIEKGKLEIAKHMIEEGMKPSIIERLTGFSAAKIKKLRKELKQSGKNKDH